MGFYGGGQGLASVLARKLADETITNSAALQDDDELSVLLAANSTYLYIGRFIVSGTATGDFKTLMTASGAPTLHKCSYHPTWDTGDLFGVSVETAEAAAAIGVGAGARAVLVIGVVVTAGAASTLKMQFAQNTAAPATSVTVSAGSILTALKVA